MDLGGLVSSAAGAVGLGPEVLGGVSSLFGTAFNARQAAIQRDFQERMAGSQVQRRVQDAIAAGVNPIFAVSGGSGAAVPSGGMASATSSPDLVASAKSAAMLNSQVEQQRYETRRSMYDAEYSLERAREQSTSAAEASQRYDAAIRSDQFEKEARASAESAKQEEQFQRDAGQTSRYLGQVVAPGASSAASVLRSIGPRGRGLR